MKKIKTIIAKILQYFKPEDFLEEKTLKNILSKYYEINFKNFYNFCKQENVNLDFRSIWLFFETQNLAKDVALIRAAFLIDDGTAIKIVAESLRQAKSDVHLSEINNKKVLRIL